MKIGSIEIDEKRAVLAPMAGVADRAFREICTGFGAAYTVSEMVSSKGIVMSDRKTEELLYLSPEQQPAAIQIFGCDPETMAEGAKKCLPYSPFAIDINMGCPAPKVANNGSGSALLKNPKLSGEIVRAVCDAVDIPVTVKIRSGWDENSVNGIEIAEILEKNGVSAVTVHGRTRQQMYAPPVNTEIISEIKKRLSIPVIGNGDIIDGFSAAEMLEKTNCDVVMIGRGALGRPWVFSQVEAFLKNGTVLPEPPVSARMVVMLKHIKLLCKYKGERAGMLEARKHAAWYMKGIRGAANYRREIFSLEKIEQLEELAFKVVKENE